MYRNSSLTAGSDDILVQLEADMKAVSVAPVVESKGTTSHIHPITLSMYYYTTHILTTYANNASFDLFLSSLICL